MDPNQGSFGAALPGGGDPIMEAMQRRQTGQAPASAQSSMSQMPMPQSSQGQPPAPSGVMANPQTGMPQEAPEAQIIIKALIDRLKNDSNMKVADQKVAQAGQGLGGM